MEEHEIFEAIRRNVLAVMPELDGHAIARNGTLSDLGLNSIDRAEVITLTIEALGIDVPVHAFHRGDTIETLVDTMRRHA
jgi:polyketide biosynthesis acyl carrier protein